jgi:repressor LexA
MGITRRMHDLLELLQHRHAAGEPVPSYEEMAAGLGLKVKSGIHRLVEGLEERGFLRRIPHRARCLELVDPDDLAEQFRARLIRKVQALPRGKRLSKAEALALIERAA